MHSGGFNPYNATFKEILDELNEYEKAHSHEIRIARSLDGKQVLICCSASKKLNYILMNNYMGPDDFCVFKSVDDGHKYRKQMALSNQKVTFVGTKQDRSALLYYIEYK